MKKFTTSLALFLILEALITTEALAARSSQRPWMARQRSSSVESVQPRRARRSVSTRRRTTVRGSAKGDRIAQQAIRYEGVKYRFGGESKSKGFDCSGLVRRIYDDLQLKKLPRTSSSLFTMGAPVRLNELRPGDLVFFKNTYKRGISHVGVYAGDNRFVHAQNRRHGVTVTPLSDPYYQLHYAGARRLH